MVQSMSTSYVGPVQEGQITTFKDFALRCSRAMGIFVSMRDTPLDAPLPDEIKPDPYYTEHLDEATKELARWEAIAPDALKEEVDKAFAEKTANYDAIIAAEMLEVARCEAMAKMLESWTPPNEEDYVGFRAFMFEQLSVGTRKPSYQSPRPIMSDPASFLEAALSEARRDVEYYTKEKKKEEDRCAFATNWLNQLRKSLEE